MKTIKKPTLFLIAILLLTALACQAANVDPATTVTINEDEIVQEVVATVSAQQLDQPVVVNDGEAGVTSTQFSSTFNSDLEQSLVSVYEQVNPAVVHIFVYSESENFNIPLGSGSGFVIDMDGHVVTNNHVVTDGDSYEVVFSDGERRRATIVGTDVDSDLAVIKVESLPANITPVTLGSSSQLKVGQFVIAIGNPFGEEGSMSVGIISGLGRTLESQRAADGGGRYSLPQVIQTDAAINPGNSGGPLLNLKGEVVGVNSAILSQSGTNSGVGFSIPVDAVTRIAPVLIRDGAYVYPFMGIRMTSLDISLQEELDLPQSTGTYVTSVSPSTPAEDAGLIGREGPGGDLIIAIDGVEVKDSDDLISYLVFEAEVGQTVDLTVIRDGVEVSVPLTLGERP